MTIYKYIRIVILLFLQKSAIAQYLPSQWIDTASLAQGNAMTSWANSESGLFSNPAGLSINQNPQGKKDKIEITSPLPNEAETNNQAQNGIYSNPNKMARDFFYSAKDNFNKPSYFSLQGFPHIVFKNKNSPAILLGITYRSENSVVYSDTTNTENATIKSINTAGAVLAISGSSNTGLFRWGILAHPNYRKEYYSSNYNIEQNERTDDFANKIIDEGIKTSAINANAGFTISVADFWFPTFGLSINNIPTGCIENYTDPITFKKVTMCGTLRYGGNSESPNESKIDPTEVRIGVSLTPRFRAGKKVINLRVAVDAYPLPISINQKNYGLQNIEQANIFHGGGELFFGSPYSKISFALRGGYMNQNATWGGGLKLGSFNLGYSSYIVPSYILLSSNSILTEYERRHTINLTINL
jgi:hypothetical protein